jgi:putative nucleotidyltransferase with HDIG domain
MNREEVTSLLEENIKNENIRKHCLAVAAIMKKLAEILNKDKEKWELIGLLHDLDYEKTAKTPEKHGLLTEEILKEKVDEEIIEIIKSHNYQNLNIILKKEESFALIASDALSGLIITTILIMPSKKLKDVKLKSVKKKFKQKDFAKNVSRENILFCEKLDLNLDQFIEIGIEGLKEISNDLGL